MGGPESASRQLCSLSYVPSKEETTLNRNHITANNLFKLLFTLFTTEYEI